jgi:hypothetical protein
MYSLIVLSKNLVSPNRNKIEKDSILVISADMKEFSKLAKNIEAVRKELQTMAITATDLKGILILFVP